MQQNVNTEDTQAETTTSLTTQDEIVRYDFQGWPEYQIRVIDLLKTLKIPTDNISKDILEKHIWVYEDDGMGYAATRQKAVDCGVETDKISIWI